MPGLRFSRGQVNFGLAALDIAYNQLLLGMLRYTPATALYITLVALPVTIVANGLAAVAIPRFGPWRCYFVGMFFVTFGFVFYALWSVYMVEVRVKAVAQESLLGPPSAGRCLLLSERPGFGGLDHPRSSTPTGCGSPASGRSSGSR